jgi:hypothetical protein
MTHAQRLFVLMLLAVAGCAAPGVPCPTGYMPGTVVIARPFGSGWMRISCYGFPLELMSATRVRGSGVYVSVTDEAGRDVWGMNSGEAELPVEVEFGEASKAELQVEYYALDGRSGPSEYVPFSRVTVRGDSDATVVVQEKLLLEGEPFDAARADELVRSAEKAMNADQSDSPETFDRRLMSLRNMGINAPEKVLDVLGRLRGDGCYGEMVEDYEAELETVRSIRAR